MNHSKSAGRQRNLVMVAIASIVLGAGFAVYYLLSGTEQEEQVQAPPVQQIQTTYLESAHRARDGLKNLKTAKLTPAPAQAVPTQVASAQTTPGQVASAQLPVSPAAPVQGAPAQIAAVQLAPPQQHTA